MTRPRLQIALDKTDLPSALAPLQRAAPQIDIIECGTVLVLAEGLRAVREIRALFPDKEILADIRIAEAGKLLSQMAFEAGASLVSVVAGASMTTAETGLRRRRRPPRRGPGRAVRRMVRCGKGAPVAGGGRTACHRQAVP